MGVGSVSISKKLTTSSVSHGSLQRFFQPVVAPEELTIHNEAWRSEQTEFDCLLGFVPKRLLIGIVQSAGDQFDPDYLKLNPNAVVPTLVDACDDDNDIITESSVILQ